MSFIARDLKVEIRNADGEWVEIGLGSGLVMEKERNQTLSVATNISVEFKGCRITNAIVDEFRKPPVVRQTEPFWAKKWRRNR